MDVSSATVKAVVVHRIGNKMRDEGYLLSSKQIVVTERLSALLLRHYLLPIARSGERYKFDHPSNIDLNEVRHFAHAISSKETSFIDGSKALAKHLYGASSHPNIGGGEFIVILFHGLLLESEPISALGLFRIEAKDDFLDIFEEDGVLGLVDRVGISMNTIQKGALVLSDSDQVYAIDKLGQKTKYWKENFLQVSPEETPQTRAKAVGVLIKTISAQVEAPAEAVLFANAVRDKIGETSTTTIANIREISSKFLEPIKLNEIFEGVQNRAGFELADDSEVQTQELTRYTRDIIRKSRIADGVNLVISKSSARIASIDVKKTASGIRATVEIKLAELK